MTNFVFRKSICKHKCGGNGLGHAKRRRQTIVYFARGRGSSSDKRNMYEGNELYGQNDNRKHVMRRLSGCWQKGLMSSKFLAESFREISVNVYCTLFCRVILVAH